MGIGKISSLAAASLAKVSSLAKASINKIDSVTASFAAAFANTRSLSKSITTGSSNAVTLVSADGLTQYFNSVVGDETSPFSISFWIKPGWDNNLNTNIHLFAVNDGSSTGRAQQYRIFFNESNNRLEFRIGQNSNNRSLNFWALHSHTGVVNAGASAGASISSSNFWSSTYTGGTNSNGFIHLVITKGTDGDLRASNIKAYWNGSALGDAFYANGNNFGTVALSGGGAHEKRIAIGSNAHNLDKSGNNNATLYDEVAIFGVELSSSNVTDLYNGGVPQDASTVVEEQPLAYYRFEGADGTQQAEISSVFVASGAPTAAIQGDSTTTTTAA